MGSTDTEINWTKEHRHQPTSSEQTLAQRREHPYLWATWLPRLLTGENSCEWAVWFKAHHQDWTRRPPASLSLNKTHTGPIFAPKTANFLCDTNLRGGEKAA